MASTNNPFSNFISSFNADPKGEAEGRYIQANTSKTQSEADILKDRLKWRGIFGNATDITPTAKAGELSNPTVDAGAAVKTTGVKAGQNLLFSGLDANGNLIPRPNINARDFGLASLMFGNSPSEATSRMMSPNGGFDKPIAPPRVDAKLAEFTDDNTKVVYRQLAHPDGSGVFNTDGSPAMKPLNPNTVKTTMPSAAGGNVLQTTPGLDGGPPTTTVFNPPGSQIVDPNQLAAAFKIAHATDIAGRGKSPDGMDDLDYIVAKRIGHMDASGKVNPNIPMLNQDELRSIQNLTRTIMAGDASIPLSSAVDAAIDHHTEISQGSIVPKDYDNRGFFDNWLNNNNGNETEKDANSVELPQMGGDKKFSTSKGYKRQLGVVTPETEARGRYSNLKDDDKVVPLSTRLAGNAVDKAGIPGIMAGATGKPEFASKLEMNAAGEPVNVVIGKFYHHQGKFYVGEMQDGGKIVARQITNTKK